MYLDVDDSGTHADCTNDVTTTVFPNLATFLRNGGRQAFLSETGGGNTASCVDLLSKELAYLKYVPRTLYSYSIANMSLFKLQRQFRCLPWIHNRKSSRSWSGDQFQGLTVSSSGLRVASQPIIFSLKSRLNPMESGPTRCL